MDNWPDLYRIQAARRVTRSWSGNHRSTPDGCSHSLVRQNSGTAQTRQPDWRFLTRARGGL